MRKLKMINIYRNKGKKDKSSEKAVKWLENHGLTFKTITSKDLTSEIIYKMLLLSDKGFDDITISKKKGEKTWNNIGLLEVNEQFLKKLETRNMIDILIKNPQLLKTPIIFNDKLLISGFNEDEIRVFLPREYRMIRK